MRPMTDARLVLRDVLTREGPRRAAALAATTPVRADDPEVQALAADLASPATAQRLADDPYWPKWDAPWWKLLALHEVGLVGAAPPAALDALGAAVAERYLTFFPFTADQVPPGTDPHRDVMCHCALGCLSELLRAAGRDVEKVVPWSRGWFLRYQLPDGGLNCDEAVYVRDVPHSSIVSTVAALEAVLGHPRRTAGEHAFLARGVRYLLDRKLGLVGASTGRRPIDARWLEPIFPRFYFYDVLRGLTLVTRWAVEEQGELEAEALAEPLLAIAARVGRDGALAAGRDDHATKTLARAADGTWEKGQPAGTFPLLERLRGPAAAAGLTARWYDALDALATLDAAGRIV